MKKINIEEIKFCPKCWSNKIKLSARDNYTVWLIECSNCNTKSAVDVWDEDEY